MDMNIDPDAVSMAAKDLAKMALNLRAAGIAAAPSVADIRPAGGDSVSTGISQVFAQHGQDFFQHMAQADVFHEQFAQHLNSAANAYTSAEATNATQLLNTIPTDLTDNTIFDLNLVIASLRTNAAWKEFLGDLAYLFYEVSLLPQPIEEPIEGVLLPVEFVFLLLLFATYF